MTKAKVLKDLPIKDYHSHSSYSSSFIKMMDTPAKAKHALQNPQVVGSPALVLGSAIHAAILQPDLYKKEFLLSPGFSKQSKTGRADWASWFKEHGAESITALPAANWFKEFEKTGLTILTDDQFTQIENIRDAVMSNPAVAPYLEGGEAEQSIFWKDLETGLNLRCRPDYLRNDFIIDLKTTVDASPDGFKRAITRYQYHIQAAHYQAGVQAAYGGDLRPFVFIAVEKSEPYLSAAYQLDDEGSDLGHILWREHLRRLADCIQSGEWPGYESNMSLQLPPWAFGSGELDMGGLL